MTNPMKASNPMADAFEALGRKFRVIEMKYNTPEEEAKRKDLVVVSENKSMDEVSEQGERETDQNEDLSGKIADLNDQFRGCKPSASSEINGEWIYGDDIKALPPTTKAAIKKKIREFPADQFVGCPLHDRGRFVHESKTARYAVIWMMKVYQDDSLLAEAEHPADPAQSYRTLAVALSDELQQDK